MAQPPPTFNDLGKTGKDFFNKGYTFGTFKMGAKRKNIIENMDSNMFCTYNIEEKTALCEFEEKYTVPRWGLTLTGKADTNRLLGYKAEVVDKLAPGLKLSVDGQFNMDNATKVGNVAAQYKTNQATMDVAVNGGDEQNVAVGGSVVFGYKDFLGGTALNYDTNEGTLKKSSITMGYLGKGWNVHGSFDDAQVVQGIAHANLTNNIEAAVQMQYNNDSAAPADSKIPPGAVGAIGIKYVAAPCSSFKAKMDSNMVYSFSCEMKVTDAVTFTASTQCDAANSNAGKVGFSLEFEQ